MNILISISFIGEKGGGDISGIHEADMCGFLSQYLNGIRLFMRRIECH